MVIKALSYNIWFERVATIQRLTLLVKIIRTHHPTFVCLQEVTPRALEFLKANLDGYHFSVTTLHRSYMELILSTYPIKDTVIVPFDSFMNRELHYIMTEVRGLEMVVGTFHLESATIDPMIKLNQFKMMFNELEGVDEVLLMGDTNITLTDEPLFVIPDHWIDLWHFLEAPEDSQFTYDQQRNIFLKGQFRDRFDRIYLKENRIYPLSMKLVGTREVGGIMPSDHFGILSQFEIE